MALLKKMVSLIDTENTVSKALSCTHKNLNTPMIFPLLKGSKQPLRSRNTNNTAEGVHATLGTQPPKVCLATGEVFDNIRRRKIPRTRQDRSVATLLSVRCSELPDS